MAWTVGFAVEFFSEYEALSEPVQNELLLGARLLERYGPSLGRPHVDTLNGSEYANMKELRFRVMTAYGAPRLRSIQSGTPSCWPRATRAEQARHGFTSG